MAAMIRSELRRQDGHVPIAEYSDERGLFRRHVGRVTVIALGDPDDPWIDDMYGLFCSARLERRTVDLPLGELEVEKDKPNRQLIDDYAYWFWNHR